MNKKLLLCGVVGGPLFIVASFVQGLLREGFDFSKHYLSSLALGDFGWIQVATFVVSGVLMLAFALGLRRAMPTGRGRLLIPILFVVYGLAMIIGGVFVDDPTFGFPPGTPETAPETMSWHGQVHVLGAVNAFIAEVVACFVFAWRFFNEGKRLLATYSAVTGLVAGGLVFTMDPAAPGSGVRLMVACVFTGSWFLTIALHYLLGDRDH